MNSCYNDKFFHKKWGGSGRPSRPASDGPAILALFEPTVLCIHCNKPVLHNLTQYCVHCAGVVMTAEVNVTIRFGFALIVLPL